jgi:hypothetical protein
MTCDTENQGHILSMKMAMSALRVSEADSWGGRRPDPFIIPARRDVIPSSLCSYSPCVGEHLRLRAGQTYHKDLRVSVVTTRQKLSK